MIPTNTLPDSRSDHWDGPATYALHQRFRYEYSAPIRRLRHRLMVVPPAVHGDQRLVDQGLAVTGAAAHSTSRVDGFGNHVIEVRAPVVEEAIEFESWVTVERGTGGSVSLPVFALHDSRYTRPSPLTRADPAITEVARELARDAEDPVELAKSVMSWVSRSIRYEHGTTHVRTTASEALATGAGVCQDYAHVMLAALRACGLAARYVSGHLVGEGGSHAWVEVLVDDRHGDQPGDFARPIPFDPTHDRVAGPGYLTVAVGRDYADVAPTSGSFRSGAVGRLSCRKRLEVTPGRLDVALATS